MVQRFSWVWASGYKYVDLEFFYEGGIYTRSAPLFFQS
jgi:hypothetical protein